MVWGKALCIRLFQVPSFRESASTFKSCFSPRKVTYVLFHEGVGRIQADGQIGSSSLVLGRELRSYRCFWKPRAAKRLFRSHIHSSSSHTWSSMDQTFTMSPTHLKGHLEAYFTENLKMKQMLCCSEGWIKELQSFIRLIQSIKKIQLRNNLWSITTYFIYLTLDKKFCFFVFFNMFLWRLDRDGGQENETFLYTNSCESGADE